MIGAIETHPSPPRALFLCMSIVEEPRPAVNGMNPSWLIYEFLLIMVSW